MRAIRLTAVLFIVSLNQLGWTQVAPTNTCPPDAPVRLQPGPVPASAGGIQNLTITNTGDKPISAVVVSWRVTDSAGMFYPSTTIVDLGPSGTSLGPQQTIEDRLDLPVKQGNTIGSVEVTCQSVMFTRGKGSKTEIWGDANGPEIAKIKATRLGIHSERTRLLHIYKAEGTTRLIEELNRPVLK